MALAFDVFWSFRSPYSYLATPRLVALEGRYELTINVRPVLPLAVRSADFFDRVNPLWPPYLMRDVSRLGEFLGLPISWPRPDPVLQVREGDRLVAPADQPHIHRLTRLGQLAAERGRGLPFLREVSHLIWSGEVSGWNEGEHLAKASERAGLDLAELDELAGSEEGRIDEAIAGNQAALEAAGHWGVPTCVFEGEPFFGQDRLDLLEWRLLQRGLRERQE